MKYTSKFVEMCRFIARGAGTKQDNGWVPEARCAAQVVCGSQYVYFDEKVVIFAGDPNLSLEVVIRKGVTPSGLSNPAVMVDVSGKVFRTHGEIKYVYDHIEKLVKNLAEQNWD